MPTSKSPIAYGYDADTLAIYFSSGPVLNVGGGGAAGGGGRGGPAIPGVGQNLTPNAIAQTLATLDGPPAAGGSRWAQAVRARSRAAAAAAAPWRRTRLGPASSCGSRRTRTTCC